MAYVKRTWSCGDKITAERLNNIEDGVEEALECCGSGGGALMVTVASTCTDLTAKEINDAFLAGQRVLITKTMSNGGAQYTFFAELCTISQSSSGYYSFWNQVAGIDGNGNLQFETLKLEASSENDPYCAAIG